jgi:bacillithiol system protein YtxJ
MFNLTSPEDVKSFLEEHPTSVVFKAGTCHKTMQGFGFLQERLQDREDLMVGVIRVVEARSASNFVAEQTAITHQSPQVILFRDGEAVFDADNWNITPDMLTDGFSQIPHTATGGAIGQAHASTDLAPYKRMLEQYLSGALSDQAFEYAYTTMFRDDASLRSKDEVEVLNSIFGDVDKHVEMHLMMGGRTTDHNAVRERAKAAYERLQRL